MSIAQQIKQQLAAVLSTDDKALYTGEFRLLDNPSLACKVLDKVAEETHEFETYRQFKTLFDNATGLTRPTKPDKDDPALHDPARRSRYSELTYTVWWAEQVVDLETAYRQQFAEYKADQEKRRYVKQKYSNDAQGYSRFVMDNLPNDQKGFFKFINPFSLGHVSRQRHTYITGGTGSGKSELIKTLIHHYMVNDQDSAVLLIDPHGDVAEEIAQFKENYFNPERLVYFDPDLSDDYTPAISPFDIPPMSQKMLDKFTQALIDVFNEVLDTEFSDQMKAILKHALPVMLLMEGTDLIDLKNFMEQADGRNKKYLRFAEKHLANPQLIDFLAVDFAKKGYDTTKQSIKTKLQQLLSLITVQRCLCGTATVDLEALINQKKIIIFNLSVGNLGEEASNIIGRFVVAQLKGMAFRRSKIPKKERVPCHVFIDECQRFLTPSIKTILAESRKYKLHLTMANQFYGQDMDSKLKKAITSNTAIKITGYNSDDSLAAFAKETKTPAEELQSFSVGEFQIKDHKKPTLKVKAPENLLEDTNAMTAEQWQEVVEFQLARYYRPLSGVGKATGGRKLEPVEMEL